MISNKNSCYDKLVEHSIRGWFEFYGSWYCERASGGVVPLVIIDLFSYIFRDFPYIGGIFHVNIVYEYVVYITRKFQLISMTIK